MIASRCTLVTCRAVIALGARALGGSAPAIPRPAARNLDLTVRDLIGHRGHLRLLLRTRSMTATARTRRSLAVGTLRVHGLSICRTVVASIGRLGLGITSRSGTEGVLARRRRVGFMPPPRGCC